MTIPDHSKPPVAPHILTLVIIAGVGPLAMNVFLPSLPGMARYFDTEYAVVQLLITAYLAATAILQLVIGPLSDRYGRKPVLVVCMSIFILATAAAIFAPTIEILLFCRLLQATSAGGMVLARAVVRDTVTSMDDAASRIGYVTMGMSVVPMIGPIVGGLLDEAYGWKSTFVLVLVGGILALLVVLFNLRETNQTRSSSMSAQFRVYPQLLKSRRFWGYSLSAGFTSAGFFAFLGGGPFVASELLGMAPSEYGLWFALISVGYMLGNYLSGRFSRLYGINTMMVAGNILTMVAGGLALGLYFVGFFNPLSLFAPTALIAIGNGITLPNANAGMVSVRPHLAGSASGLGGTLQIGCGAALAFVAGALLSHESGPSPLYWVLFATGTCGTIAALYVVHVARQVQRGN